MKTIEDYEPVYIKCWVIYEALRRFGFGAEQLAPVHNCENGMLGIKLEASNKQFIAGAGLVTDDNETIDKIWDEIGNLVIDENVPDTSFNKVWQEYMSLEEYESLGMALIKKGIVIPKFTN